MKIPPLVSCLCATVFVAASLAPGGPEPQTATPAHRLALAILRDAPQRPPTTTGAGASQPGAAADRSGELLQRLPLDWDETRLLEPSGDASQIMARRHREEWFVGATAGPGGRTLDLNFHFLSPNRPYVAHLFEDHPANGQQPGTRYTAKKITATDRIALPLRARGGIALWITPDLKRR